MNNPTAEQIAKLPKWAQDRIKQLERERENAVRQLNEYVDQSTPSRFYTDDMVSTGESSGPSIKRAYIQAHSITAIHAGIRLDINCFRDGQIALQWETPSRGCAHIAFVPESFQRALLIHPDNLRK